MIRIFFTAYEIFHLFILPSQPQSYLWASINEQSLFNILKHFTSLVLPHKNIFLKLMTTILLFFRAVINLISIVNWLTIVIAACFTCCVQKRRILRNCRRKKGTADMYVPKISNYSIALFIYFNSDFSKLFIIKSKSVEGLWLHVPCNSDVYISVVFILQK